MTLEHPRGLSGGQPERQIVHEKNISERSPNEATLESVTEWVDFMEHHFISPTAPFRKPLDELREKYPEAHALLERIAIEVRMSAAQASAEAKKMAKIDDDTWKKGIHRANG